MVSRKSVDIATSTRSLAHLPFGLFIDCPAPLNMLIILAALSPHLLCTTLKTLFSLIKSVIALLLLLLLLFPSALPLFLFPVPPLTSSSPL